MSECCLYAWKHVRMYAIMLVCIYVPTHMHAHIRTHTHIYVHTYTSICKYVPIYTCTRLSLPAHGAPPVPDLYCPLSSPRLEVLATDGCTKSAGQRGCWTEPRPSTEPWSELLKWDHIDIYIFIYVIVSIGISIPVSISISISMSISAYLSICVFVFVPICVFIVP